MGLVHRVVCLLTSGYASNKLYCLVTGAHRCERLAQSRYTAVPGRDWTHDLLIVNPTPYHCATHEKLDAQCDKQAKVVGWTWTVWQAGKHFDRWWLSALTASVHLCQAKLTTRCNEQWAVAKFSKSRITEQSSRGKYHHFWRWMNFLITRCRPKEAFTPKSSSIHPTTYRNNNNWYQGITHSEFDMNNVLQNVQYCYFWQQQVKNNKLIMQRGHRRHQEDKKSTQLYTNTQLVPYMLQNTVG